MQLQLPRLPRTFSSAIHTVFRIVPTSLRYFRLPAARFLPLPGRLRGLLGLLPGLLVLLTLTGIPHVWAGKTGGPVIRYVKQTGNGDGSSWANASGDLQAMIDASGVTEVWVATGIYKPTTGTDRTISFAMKDGVAIYGGFTGTETDLSQRPAINPVAGQPSSTTLSGDIGIVGSKADNSYHVIKNPQGLTTSAVLDGFVITGGYADGSGYTNENVGGGILNLDSSPTLTNCILLNNFALVYGGGIVNFSYSSPALTNCSFQNNTTDYYGGGIYNGYSSPTLTNCSFQNNSATEAGGGIYNTGSRPTLTNCTLLSNSATNGGGISNFSSSTPQLVNCVLWNNGGDKTIFNEYNEDSSPSTVTASYSLFDNTVTGYNNIYAIDQPGNLTTTTSPFASANSVALAPNSPAINAGSNEAYTTANGPATDLAGNPRVFPADGTIDMGAVEYQALPAMPPVITMQPASASTVCAGTSVSVAVTVTGATAYQWLKGSSPVTGQNSATLTLTNVQPADAGVYSLSATGPDGSVVSNTFTLTVNAKPVITAQPVGATKCENESYTFTVTASNAGGYQWQKDGVDIAGAISTDLVLTDLTVSKAGTYRVRITGAATCSGESLISNEVALVVNERIELYITNPYQQVCEGGEVFFEAKDILGTASNYQWYRNGVVMDGETSFLLYILNVSVANNNDKYTVRVPMSCNNFISDEAILTVNAKPVITNQPVGTTRCVGENYTFTVTATNAGGYQWQKDGVDIAGAVSANLVLTNLSAADAGTYRVYVIGAEACNSEFLTSNGAVLVVNTPVTINTQPQATTVCEGSNATFTVQASGTITGYQWYRNGTAIAGAVGNSYQLTTSTTNNNDKFKVDVIGSCGTVTSAEATLTVNARPVITAQPVGATRCVGDNYTFTVMATNPGNYQWQRDGVDIAGAMSANLVLSNLTTASAGTYRVRITGAATCNGVTSNEATLTVNTKPVITAHPQPTTVTEGTNATFSVQATGTITGYQWYRNSVVIDGANAATYQFTTSLTNNNDKFKVDVINSCGTVTSNEALLTVTPASSPASQTVCRGSQVVVKTGLVGTRYEWYKNGQSAPFKLTEIASIQRGTATNSLTLVSLQTTATFYCKVFQANGTFVFSGPFTVTVNYGCIAPGARAAAPEEVAAEVSLRVTLTPNPLVDGQLRAVVVGAGGQPLRVQLVSLSGTTIESQTWPSAQAEQVVSWDLRARPSGLYLLQVSTPGQPRQSVKVINP